MRQQRNIFAEYFTRHKTQQTPRILDAKNMNPTFKNTGNVVSKIFPQQKISLSKANSRGIFAR